MQLRKVLCATDFSAGSEEALKVAARIATEHASELVVVHVWYVPPVVFANELGYPAELVRGVTDDAERGLAKALDQARALGVPQVSSLLLDGPPWDKIVEAAEVTPEVDLIVVGTSGRTGIARAFLGSVAEMVVRHSPCSVLAVPSGGNKVFKRTLVPIDFSASSQLALELAADLGRTANGALTLVHVIEPPHITTGSMTEPAGLARRAREMLDQWIATVAGSQRDATASVHVGNPTEELRSMLGDYDLVAMGCHGRTGVRRMLLGSIAETIVRHAQCAVLVARPR